LIDKKIVFRFSQDETERENLLIIFLKTLKIVILNQFDAKLYTTYFLYL